MSLRCLMPAVWMLMLLIGWQGGASAQSSMEGLIPAGGKQVTLVKAGEDAGVLRIDGAAKRVDSRDFPIQGGGIYQITIQARVEGDFVVEANDRAHQLTLESFRYARASTYQLLFLDKEGKPVESFGAGGRGFFLTRQWHAYTMAFHTPEQATAVRLRFTPSKHDTLLRDVRLTELRDLPTVNLNPDFRYGELNYSGWQPSRDGRLYTRPDGVTVFKPGYGGSSGIFPLDPQYNYKATAKGAGGTINLVYYDRDGKQINSRFLVRPNEKGDASAQFIPPENAAYGKLLTYSITYLASCEVVKTGKANP